MLLDYYPALSAHPRQRPVSQATYELWRRLSEEATTRVHTGTSEIAVQVAIADHHGRLVDPETDLPPVEPALPPVGPIPREPEARGPDRRDDEAVLLAVLAAIRDR